MAGWVADKFWLLIMVLQIDSENSATGIITKVISIYNNLFCAPVHRIPPRCDASIAHVTVGTCMVH